MSDEYKPVNSKTLADVNAANARAYLSEDSASVSAESATTDGGLFYRCETCGARLGTPEAKAHLTDHPGHKLAGPIVRDAGKVLVIKTGAGGYVYLHDKQTNAHVQTFQATNQAEAVAEAREWAAGNGYRMED